MISLIRIITFIQYNRIANLISWLLILTCRLIEDDEDKNWRRTLQAMHKEGPRRKQAVQTFLGACRCFLILCWKIASIWVLPYISPMNKSCCSSLICTERDPLLTAHAQESWRALLYHHIMVFIPIFLIFSRALIYFKYSHCYYPPNLLNNNHPIISSVLNVSRIKVYFNLIIFQTIFEYLEYFGKGKGQ